MSLTFFSDQCVPNTVIKALEKEGHDVFILKEHIPRDSVDAVVIKKAHEMGAILISLNGDFADIATYPPSHYNGIIALQIRNHPEAINTIVQRLIQYLSTHPEMNSYKGRLLLVEAHRIRIRR